MSRKCWNFIYTENVQKCENSVTFAEISGWNAAFLPVLLHLVLKTHQKKGCHTLHFMQVIEMHTLARGNVIHSTSIVICEQRYSSYSFISHLNLFCKPTVKTVKITYLKNLNVYGICDPVCKKGSYYNLSNCMCLVTHNLTQEQGI